MLNTLKCKTTEGIELTYNEGEITINDKNNENNITVCLSDFKEFINMLYNVDAIEITVH